MHKAWGELAYAATNYIQGDTHMKKKDLVYDVARKNGMTQKETEKLLDSFLDSMTQALKAGDKVQLVGFGSLEVKSRAARMGRNPVTGEAIRLPVSKTPIFRAGKRLKEELAKQ